MRLLRLATAIAFAFAASPLLAQAADPHAGHHPDAAAPPPDANAPPADATCPMMAGMKDGKSGPMAGSAMGGSTMADKGAMQERMKQCMDMHANGMAQGEKPH